MTKEKYQKEPIISFISSSGVVPAESSSSTMAEYKELPLLMSITSKDIEKKVHRLFIVQLQYSM
jgi:hypothetical protein